MRKLLFIFLLLPFFVQAQVSIYRPYRTNGNVIVKDSILAAGRLLLPVNKVRSTLVADAPGWLDFTTGANALRVRSVTATNLSFKDSTFNDTRYPAKATSNTFTGANTYTSPSNSSITAPDNRIDLSNPIASTSVTVRQTSPSLKWSASAWNTTSLVSQPASWEVYVYGNSSNPITSTWQLKATVNGVATYPLQITDAGIIYGKTFNTSDFNTALVKANASGNLVAAVAGTDYAVPTPIVEITGTTQTASVGTIYIPHNASQTTITAPSATIIGSLIQIIGEGAGGWKLQLPVGYSIKGVGGFTTTSGGSVASTDRYCTITVRLVATNTFVVTTSQGTLTPL